MPERWIAGTPGEEEADRASLWLEKFRWKTFMPHSELMGFQLEVLIWASLCIPCIPTYVIPAIGKSDTRTSALRKIGVLATDLNGHDDSVARKNGALPVTGLYLSANFGGVLLEDGKVSTSNPTLSRKSFEFASQPQV